MPSAIIWGMHRTEEMDAYDGRTGNDPGSLMNHDFYTIDAKVEEVGAPWALLTLVLTGMSRI